MSSGSQSERVWEGWHWQLVCQCTIRRFPGNVRADKQPVPPQGGLGTFSNTLSEAIRKGPLSLRERVGVRVNQQKTQTRTPTSAARTLTLTLSQRERAGVSGHRKKEPTTISTFGVPLYPGFPPRGGACVSGLPDTLLALGRMTPLKKALGKPSGPHYHGGCRPRRYVRAGAIAENSHR